MRRPAESISTCSSVASLKSRTLSTDTSRSRFAGAWPRRSQNNGRPARGGRHRAGDRPWVAGRGGHAHEASRHPVLPALGGQPEPAAGRGERSAAHRHMRRRLKAWGAIEVGTWRSGSSALGWSSGGWVGESQFRAGLAAGASAGGSIGDQTGDRGLRLGEVFAAAGVALHRPPLVVLGVSVFHADPL